MPFFGTRIPSRVLGQGCVEKRCGESCNASEASAILILLLMTSAARVASLGAI